MNKLLTSESTDKQLYELATRVGIHVDYIIFINELKCIKLQKNKICNIIINLYNTDTNSGIRHWIALYYDGNHSLYYFNSFSNLIGQIPKQVFDICNKFKCILSFNNIAIQDPKRGFCGQYCIYWLYMINRSTNDIKDFNSFLKKFSNMSTDVINYIQRHPMLSSN